MNLACPTPVRFQCLGRRPLRIRRAHALVAPVSAAPRCGRSHRRATLFGVLGLTASALLSGACASLPLFAAPADSLRCPECAPLPSGYRLERYVSGLNRPVAITWTPDGRLLVTEQTGDIRVVERGRLQSKPWASIASVRVINESGLVGIATDPDFLNNHFVYVAYTELAPEVNEAPRLVVSRLQERGGAAGIERARLLDVGLPTTGELGMLHFGPGGALYIAVRMPAPPMGQRAAAELAGRILRIAAGALASANGATAVATVEDARVYAADLVDPWDFTFQGDAGTMYVLDRGVKNEDEVRLVPSRAVRQGAQPRDAVEAPLQPLATVQTYQPRVGSAGITAYEADRLAAFRGDLLVCSGAGARLRRLRLANDRQTVVDDQPIAPSCSGGVATGPDGFLYFVDSVHGRILRIRN